MRLPSTSTDCHDVQRDTCDRRPTADQTNRWPRCPSAGTLNRWFLVTNGFKTTLVAIDLRGTIYNDPVSQGVASLVFVFIMLAATLRVMPYGKPDSNFLEAKLFGVVRWGQVRVRVGVGSGSGALSSSFPSPHPFPPPPPPTSSKRRSSSPPSSRTPVPSVRTLRR